MYQYNEQQNLLGSNILVIEGNLLAKVNQICDR